jgi:hypothetical protein
VGAERGVGDDPRVGDQHVDASGLLRDSRVERVRVGRNRAVGAYAGDPARSGTVRFASAPVP